VAASNPDVEVVSTNNDRGLVTFREKSTGKMITLDLERIREGKLAFTSDDKEVHVEAGEGGLRVRSSDGETAVIGNSPARLPPWLPAYPGADMRGGMAATNKDKESALVGFRTADSFGKVLDFYTEALRNNGFTVDAKTIITDTTAVLSAKSESPRRSAVINIQSEHGETNVALMFSGRE
jgi:hypothetical protein